MNARKKKWLDIVGSEPKTLDELGDGVCKVIRHNLKRRKHVTLEGVKWMVDYQETVPNTHSRPFDGVQNYGYMDDSKPKGYPGFAGRVWVRYFCDPGSGWEALENTGTHTGTGGYGAYSGPWQEIASGHYRQAGRNTGPYCLSWDYRFFLQDWPLIEKSTEKNLTMQRLKGKAPRVTHTYEFFDEEAHAEDRRLLKKWKNELEKL
tara:strand:- start:6571 stop:7185 length:615 start_codon:yes stop_codon:yes gene_type:complete